MQFDGTSHVVMYVRVPWGPYYSAGCDEVGPWWGLTFNSCTHFPGDQFSDQWTTHFE